MYNGLALKKKTRIKAQYKHNYIQQPMRSTIIH